MTSLLWAQAVAAPPEAFSWGALVGVAFFAFLAIVVVSGIWQEKHKAAMAHAETLKRLELGIPDPPLDRSWPLAMICIAIGLGVPATAFGATLIAYLNKTGLHDEIWFAPTVVSLVSVLKAGGLARKLLRDDESDRNLADGPESASKSAGDPDAIDVAGRRG